jgi:uncharacterized protein (DUF58 family)
MKWDAARRLAGALGYLGLAGGERVEITSFAQSVDDSFGPTRGKRQVIAALKHLAAITPAPPFDAGSREKGGLASSLNTYASRHPAGGLLVLVSDLLDTAAPLNTTSRAEELAEGLRQLTPPRWQVLIMHLLTAEEIRPTLQGDYDLEDVETRQRLPFHLDERTLIRYRERVYRWCAALQSACARRSATYSRILADWPIEQKVIPYLRQRGIVQ